MSSDSGGPGQGPLVATDPDLERALATTYSGARGALTVGIWTAQVLLFIVLFGSGASPATIAVAILAMLLVLTATLSGGDILLFRQARRLLRNAEFGRLDEVIAWHERAIPRSRGGIPRIMFAHDLGHYELRRGNLGRALAIHATTYQAMQRTKRVDRRLMAMNRDHLAVTYAAQGNLEAAEAWLVDPSSRYSVHPAAAAVVYARAGQWERVLALEWPALPPQMERAMRHSQRVYSVMRALARSATGDPDLADDLQAGRPGYAGELDYLATDWPELRAIIERLPPAIPTGDAEGLPESRLLRR